MYQIYVLFPKVILISLDDINILDPDLFPGKWNLLEHHGPHNFQEIIFGQ